MPVAKYAITGLLTVQEGTARFYPDRNATITAVFFSLGVAPVDNSTIIDVKKNGTTIFASPPSCTPGEFKSNRVQVDVDLTEDDYLTVDVLQANDAEDASVTIVYA